MASRSSPTEALRSSSTNYWTTSPEPPIASPSRFLSAASGDYTGRLPSVASPGPIASTSALPSPTRDPRIRFARPDPADGQHVGRSPARASSTAMETIDLTDSSPPSTNRPLPVASDLVPAGPYWNDDGNLIPLPLPRARAQVQEGNAIASGSGRTESRPARRVRMAPQDVIILSSDSSDDSESEAQVRENQENARRARMDLPLIGRAANRAAHDRNRRRNILDLARNMTNQRPAPIGRGKPTPISKYFLKIIALSIFFLPLALKPIEQSIMNTVYSTLGRFASQAATDLARRLTAGVANVEEDRQEFLYAEAAAAAGGAGGWNQAANNPNRGLGPRSGRGRGGAAPAPRNRGGGPQDWRGDNVFLDRNARDFSLEALPGYEHAEYLRYMRHLEDVEPHLFGPGGGGGGGLQGLMQSGVRVTKAKKYGVKLSHPRKLEEGFTRSINPPPELRDTPPPSPPHPKSKRKKGIPLTPAETEPICGSCLELLLLAQSGEKRPWALRCGHVVCGNCVGEAKMRCEEMNALERKSRWKMDELASKAKKATKKVQRSNGRVVVTTDSEDEVQVASAFGPTRSRTTSTKPSAAPYPLPSILKGKGKSLATETGVVENWTMCPVVGCDGNGTDLLAKEGQLTGAFELFV